MVVSFFYITCGSTWGTKGLGLHHFAEQLTSAKYAKWMETALAHAKCRLGSILYPLCIGIKDDAGCKVCCCGIFGWSETSPSPDHPVHLLLYWTNCSYVATDCTGERWARLLQPLPVFLTDEDDANRLGEKVILREQVKELFNEKYGEWPHRMPMPGHFTESSRS